MFTTLDDYKDYLNLNTDDTTEDAYYTALIGSVEESITSYLGSLVISSSYTDIFDGCNTSDLFLSQYNVKTVTNVSILRNSVWETITGYIASSVGMLSLIDGTTFDLGFQNVKVEYTAGLDAYPKDLVLAAKKLLALEYKEMPKGNNTLGVSSTVKNVQGASMQDNTDKGARERIFKSIEKYRSPNI